MSTREERIWDEIQPLYNGKSGDEWIASLEPMEFYLHFNGSLPSNPDNASVVKNTIRQQIHPQMRELWRKEQILKSVSSSVRTYKSLHGDSYISGLQFHAEHFQRGPYKFVPLVCGDLGNVCQLDILFFRREDNRALIVKSQDQYGGDLDNRLKIFFDGLKAPDINQANQLEGLSLPAEEPVFCLVADDSLITKFQIDSSYLLEPPASDHRDDNNQVKLLVRVVTKRARYGETTLGYETRFFGD